ncbi:hypothetical protein PQR15_33625 [Streptomyces lydicus]|nr:hypothetical protein [Streptomyces lydicus]
MPEHGSAPLDALPPTASGSQVWAALGRAGLIAEVYRDGAAGTGVDPGRLAGLLGAVDARFSLAATLSASVQLATALPLLATGRTPVARQALGVRSAAGPPSRWRPPMSPRAPTSPRCGPRCASTTTPWR